MLKELPKELITGELIDKIGEAIGIPLGAILDLRDAKEFISHLYKSLLKSPNPKFLTPDGKEIDLDSPHLFSKENKPIKGGEKQSELNKNIKPPIQVSENLIKSSLSDSDMLSLQEKVSLHMVQRYIKKLEDGFVSPPIKVVDNTIIDGNHRYVAGKIYGKLPDMIPSVLPPGMKSLIKPVKEIKIDLKDWGGY